MNTVGDDRLSRRAVIEGLGVVAASGLAGCESPSPPVRWVTELDATGLERLPVSFESTIERATITADRTARLRLGIHGEGEGRIDVEFGSYVPFNTPQASTPAGILLLAAPGEYGRRSSRTWVPDPDSGDSIYPLPVVRQAELLPGETISGSWEVWADPENATRIEPGTYEFHPRLGVGSSERNVVLSMTIERG